MSNALIATVSDVKNIRISNINRLIFGHLNIISFRSKFGLLCKQIKGSLEIFMISETKLDDSFPQDQFLIEGFQSPFRFARHKTGGKILLISKTVDKFTIKYENILLLGDFNTCADDESMKIFCNFYGLHSFIKQPTCYKNTESPSCIDLI